MKCLATLIVLTLLVPLAFAAFSQQPQQIAEKPPNTEADVAAIKRWIDRYCATVTAGDFDAYRAFWTEDVVWLPPHGPVQKGIEACISFSAHLVFVSLNIWWSACSVAIGGPGLAKELENSSLQA